MTDSELKSRIIAHFLGQNGDLLSYLVVFSQYIDNKFYKDKENFVYTPTYNELLTSLSPEKFDFEHYIQYRRVLTEIIENFK